MYKHFSSLKILLFALVLASTEFAVAGNYLAGVNYSNGQLYALCFDNLAEGQEPLRSTISANGGVKPVSLTFYTGKTDELGKEELQLFVADEAGVIRRFAWGEITSLGTEPQTDCNNIVIEEKSEVYNKTSGGGLSNPNGLAIAPTDKLIVLDSSNGTGSSKLWSFDILTPNSAPKLLLDNIAHNSLEESTVLPANVLSTDLQEDLLIVATNPSTILKVDKSCITQTASLCSPASVSHFIGGNSGVPLDGEPSGIAIVPAPNQNKLLVSLKGGNIAVYDISSGVAVLENPSLVAGLGAGKFKIKTLRDVNITNIDSAEVITFEANVYVAGRNNGSIKEIKISVENGVVVVIDEEIKQVSVGIEHPRGLASTSDDFIRIAQCTNDCPDKIVVDISSVLQHSWDPSVVSGENLSGYIGETYHVLKDPRLACNESNFGVSTQPLYISNDNVYLTQPNDPYSVEIPAHLCGSPANDPHLILVRTVSDIDPSKIAVDHKAFDTDFDDNGEADLNCYSEIREQQPALGWAPIPELGEDTIVEGQKIIDTATGCGSVRAKTKEYSYFVIGLRYRLFPLPTSKSKKKSAKEYTAKYGELIHEELGSLAMTIHETKDIAGCDVNQSQAQIMLEEIVELQENIAANKLRQVDVDMLNILNKLRDNDMFLSIEEKSLSCNKNYQGNLLSRGTHLYFSIATKLLQKAWNQSCSADSLVEECF